MLVSRLRPPRAPRAVALILLVALVAGGWRPVGARALPPPNGLRITFLDVGQGDGALLQVPGGAVLVDEGPPRRTSRASFGRLGVRTCRSSSSPIPSAITSAGRRRCSSGCASASSSIPPSPARAAEERAALELHARRRVRVVVARAGQGYRIGRLRLRILWPDGPGPPGDDPNDHAIVILASYGEVDALSRRTPSRTSRRRLHVPPVEILKVAHHGSGDPGLARLLERIRPRSP